MSWIEIRAMIEVIGAILGALLTIIILAYIIITRRKI